MYVKLIQNIGLKLFERNNGNQNIQILRYLLAGFLAFSIDAFFLFTLTEYLHFHYLLSTVLAYSVGLFVSYFANIRWVFNKRKQKKQTMEILIFILITLFGLLITYVSMWYLTSKLNLFYLISKIITVIVVFIWNFLLKKKILF